MEGTHALRLKSLWPLACVWAVWAGQGRTLKLEKWGHLLLCPWHFVYQFTAISNEMELPEELSDKNFQFLLQ